jgi:hypothetical protein
LKGTVSVSQDAPSIEKILVDQFDAPIGITTEPGDFTFEAELPSMAEADLIEWLGESGLHKYIGHSIDGKQILGINLNGEIIKASVMVLGLLGIASMWYAVFADSGVAMLCVLNSVRVLRIRK